MNLIRTENIFYKCHVIKIIMLRSPFYVFKNNFQKQTKDNGFVEVKIGGPCKILDKNVA